ncbi:hypothetical protein O6H91_06G070200 [Diphasiastrum complanatum]|uniref:Uncharacterized protein n=1 Tax=Diphasiastrum complanatum TaxID=34168 RepID=A0ACC2DEU7_DIPCM|nr:hypothetical protein O6H91_06G070200 [Diphasiastrum complanatum]
MEAFLLVSHAQTSSQLSNPRIAASIFSNQPLIAAFFSFALAQSLKVFTSWYKDKRWDVKKLIASGGMPSSHSATVMGLAVAVGLKDGTGTALFAISLVLASIVMYDASGVRLQAGRQAEVLNQIVFELPPEHPLSDSRPLREILGHTHAQVVAGAILGAFLAYALHLISSAGAAFLHLPQIYSLSTSLLFKGTRSFIEVHSGGCHLLNSIFQNFSIRNNAMVLNKVFFVVLRATFQS